MSRAHDIWGGRLNVYAPLLFSCPCAESIENLFSVSIIGRAEGASLSGSETPDSQPKIIRIDWLPSFFFLNFLVSWFYERQLTPNYATPIFYSMIMAVGKTPFMGKPWLRSLDFERSTEPGSSKRRNFP